MIIRITLCYLILLSSGSIGFSQKASTIGKTNFGFIENKGQVNNPSKVSIGTILFYTETPNTNVYITDRGITFLMLQKPESETETTKELIWERISLDLRGANIDPLKIETELPIDNSRRFYSNQNEGKRIDVNEYDKITLKDIYPGVDWILYNSHESGFKYDFIVHPGTDPELIQLVYNSQQEIEIDPNGNLQFFTSIGKMKEGSPLSFIDNKTTQSNFKITSQSLDNYGGYQTVIELEFPELNFPLTHLLRIDPELQWFTFFGGNVWDGPKCIDTDNNDNLFIAGYSTSINLPVMNTGSYYQGTLTGNRDLLLMKFTNQGEQLWTTYYGGIDYDCSNYMDIDNWGNVYITGSTYSDDFPLQDYGTFFQGTKSLYQDAIILKFDNDGNRLWSTYYGGNHQDEAYGVKTDLFGNVFITGKTRSTDFPVQDAATYIQSTQSGTWESFIVKFDSLGNRIWSTYFGGASNDEINSLTIDKQGQLFIHGKTTSSGNSFPLLDAGSYYDNTNSSNKLFISKFTNNGVLLWSTLYGGVGGDNASTIITDDLSNIFTLGFTNSADFPTFDNGSYFKDTITGQRDVYISKFDNYGNLLWSTLFGGTQNDMLIHNDKCAINSNGDIIIGYRCLSDAVLLPSCDWQYYDSTYAAYNTVLTQFDNNGQLKYSSYLSGDGTDGLASFAYDSNDNLFITGELLSPINLNTYPLLDPGNNTYFDGTYNGSDDAFILKFISTANGMDTSIISTCDSFTVPSGNNTYSTSGYYIDTLNSMNGCDSVFVIDLTIINIDTSVTLMTNTLFSNASNSTYQWINCDNGQQIIGETNPTFQPDSSGHFAVIVTEGSCTDTSSCYTITTSSINDKDDFEIKIFPNPGNEVIHIKAVKNVNLLIYDSSGKLFFRNDNPDNSFVINTKQWSNGIYEIQVSNNSSLATRKLIISH